MKKPFNAQLLKFKLIDIYILSSINEAAQNFTLLEMKLH